MFKGIKTDTKSGYPTLNKMTQSTTASHHLPPIHRMQIVIDGADRNCTQLTQQQPQHHSLPTRVCLFSYAFPNLIIQAHNKHLSSTPSHLHLKCIETSITFQVYTFD